MHQQTRATNQAQVSWTVEVALLRALPNVWTACSNGRRNCQWRKRGCRADTDGPGRSHRKRPLDLRGRAARQRGAARGLPGGRCHQQWQGCSVHSLPSTQRLRAVRGVESGAADNGAKPVRQHAAERSRFRAGRQTSNTANLPSSTVRLTAT